MGVGEIVLGDCVIDRAGATTPASKREGREDATNSVFRVALMEVGFADALEGYSRQSPGGQQLLDNDRAQAANHLIRGSIPGISGPIRLRKRGQRRRGRHLRCLGSSGSPEDVEKLFVLLKGLVEFGFDAFEDSGVEHAVFYTAS
jgi:hypothetical protein